MREREKKGKINHKTYKTYIRRLKHHDWGDTPKVHFFLFFIEHDLQHRSMYAPLRHTIASLLKPFDYNITNPDHIVHSRAARLTRPPQLKGETNEGDTKKRSTACSSYNKIRLWRPFLALAPTGHMLDTYNLQTSSFFRIQTSNIFASREQLFDNAFVGVVAIFRRNSMTLVVLWLFLCSMNLKEHSLEPDWLSLTLRNGWCEKRKCFVKPICSSPNTFLLLSCVI